MFHTHVFRPAPPFCLGLAVLLALQTNTFAMAGPQEPASKLSLVIVEGDGAINNLRQRVNREPIVQVEDENHKPIAGAVVTFLLPTDGPSATFPDGSHSLTVTTDANGRAVARGLRPNSVNGKVQIRISASYGGQTVSATITQTNAIGAAAAAGGTAGISAKWIVIIAAAAGAAAGGAYWATHTGSSSSTPTVPPTSISAGTPTVGAPR